MARALTLTTGSVIAHLRQTGQRHRLPYWTSLMPEEDDEKVLAAFREQGEFLSS